MTCHVRVLLRASDTAFRSGDGALYRAARAELKGGIKNAKADYKKRIEDHLSSNNPRQVWQGIQNITNYRACVVTTGNPGVSLAEELNSFFARFETQHPATPSSPTSPDTPHSL
ncbi:hypothetical protein AAFF_G00003720 [Aldrovandia affinis]|uniref:Uncharacterized protein n=1 Tax=Aldrovandia affinis TaxID=143900 RepID=A0AAD7X3P8_9TELE|nr:hypothetical protein AAFF_G00003720 [Aldrovandia affinis]